MSNDCGLTGKAVAGAETDGETGGWRRGCRSKTRAVRCPPTPLAPSASVRSIAGWVCGVCGVCGEGTVQVQSTAASKSAANTETAEDGDVGASVQADTNMLSTTPVAEVSQNVAARKKVSKNVAAGYTNE